MLLRDLFLVVRADALFLVTRACYEGSLLRSQRRWQSVIFPPPPSAKVVDRRLAKIESPTMSTLAAHPTSRRLACT